MESHLSFVGRLTLAKYVISTISGYLIETNLLPKLICNEVEKMERNFLWVSQETRGKCDCFHGRQYVHLRKLENGES